MERHLTYFSYHQFPQANLLSRLIETNSPRLPLHTNKHLLSCTFCKCLTNPKANLKESHNQVTTQIQVTTKNMKKKTGFTWNPQRHCMRLCFSNSAPTSFVNFSNNISILHIAWYNLWNLLTLNLKEEFFHISIKWLGLYLQ